jgi:hypothetical protein
VVIVATVADPVASRMHTDTPQASSKGEMAPPSASRTSMSDRPAVTSTCFSAPPAPIANRMPPAGVIASVQIAP